MAAIACSALQRITMRLMQRPLLPLADLCKNLDFAHALDLGNQLLLCESSQSGDGKGVTVTL